eukprot:g1503.t1
MNGQELETMPTATKSLFLEKELKIGGVLGQGGFGVVREAHYLGEKVAVKDFNSDSTHDNNTSRTGNISEQSIQNEAYIMNKKRHKNTVGFIYHWRSERRLVMEYCGNGSLFDFIRNESKRSIVEDWSNRLRWMRGVALGMNALHSEPPPVLHRDLSSRNIFLDDHLEAKVGDYGLAKKLCEAQNSQGSCSESNIDLVYQPPEVRKERLYSTKSDVYSFGVIMHEMLCIKGPYGFSLNENNLSARVEHYLMEDGKPTVSDNRQLLPGKWYPCLEEYINLMNRCLDDNPENRPDFVTIEQRLLEIWKQYKDAVEHERGIKRIYKILKVICVTFPVLLVTFLILHCVRIISLSKEDGNRRVFRMESSEYFVFLSVVVACIVVLGIIGIYFLRNVKESICSFFRTVIGHIKQVYTVILAKVRNINWRSESPEPIQKTPSAFSKPPSDKEMFSGMQDIEMGENGHMHSIDLD